jgi:hypothetical protein
MVCQTEKVGHFKLILHNPKPLGTVSMMPPPVNLSTIDSKQSWAYIAESF